MSVGHAQDGAASEFVVRPDGTVVGSDGAAGALAAALPYTGRLARRMGELAGVGDLRGMEALGRRRLEVTVTWTPAGEGTYRARAHAVEPRVVPHFTVVGAVDTTTAVDHCLGRLMSVGEVGWSTVVTAGSRVIAARGERRDLQHLEEVGNRMLAILRSLEDQHASGFMRLRFEQGAVIGASLGRHAIVAGVGSAADGELVMIIDEIRAILASRDLASVQTEFDADGDAGEAPREEATAPPVVTPPPLVGARFAGAGEPRPKAARRRRFRSR